MSGGGISGTGVLIVQHGDFPFDFIEKHREMYEYIESIMEKLSEASRKLPRKAGDDPHSEDSEKLAAVLKTAGYDLEIGYLDFALPTIEDAFDKLAARGHKRVVFACSPGLMMRSSHSLIDVPGALRSIKAANPGIEVLYAQPGIPYPIIIQAFMKKIKFWSGETALEATIVPAAAHPGTGVVLVGHGDVPLDFIRQKGALMEKTESQAEQWSDMVRDWPRTELNDPNYYDTILLRKELQEKLWRMPIEVGYLEFASPSADVAFNKLVRAGAKRVLIVGGTGFFDRSSHTLLDIPDLIASLTVKYPDVEIVYAFPDIDLVMGELVRAIEYKIERAIEGEVMQL